MDLISIIFIIIGIIFFSFIKNKKIKYIGMLISVILNIFLRPYYSFGYRLILNLVIIIIAITFLIRQRYLMKKENGLLANYESSLGLRLICFFIPLVGLIIYAVNIVQNPKVAKECGKFSLIGFIVGLIISITCTLIIMLQYI